MTVWQIIIAAMLVTSIACGRPHWRVAAVMVCNIAFSMRFGSDYLLVGVADLVCAALLIGISTRAYIVAGLFALMVPVYVAATYYQWTTGTTYAIIDLIAYAQFGVLGRVDGGVGYVRGVIDRRWDSSVPRYLAGGRGSSPVGMDSYKNRWQVITATAAQKGAQK